MTPYRPPRFDPLPSPLPSPQDGSSIQKHYDQYGREDWEKDELGHQTTFNYDPYDRVSSVINPPRATGQPSLHTDYTYARYPSSTNELAHTANQPRQITSTGGKLTLFQYDNNFRALFRTDGYSSPDAAITSWTYDSAGNIQTSKDPAGVVTTNGYDERNRLTTVTTPVGKTTIFYDDAGNITKKYSPDGQSVAFDQYDGMNRLKHGIDERGKTIAMDYYASGNLQNFTDSNTKVYHYDYDSLDQRSKLTYPDGSYEEWLSQANGLLQSVRNRAAVTQNFSTYDLRDRLKAYSWSDGTVPSVAIGYDAAGRVTNLNNSNSNVTRAYYDDDTLKSETQAITGAHSSRQINYTPNNEGLPHRIQYPNGIYLRQTFDNLDRLIFAGQDDGTDANLTGSFATYAYNFDSTRKNIVRPNTVQTDYTYETPVTGRIKNINHYIPGTPAKTISSRTYGYDALDRMRWFQKSNSTQTNPLENGKGESYGYDQAGQLNAAAYEVVNPSATNNVPNDSLLYDNAGNRSAVNGVAYTLNSKNVNQYATAGSYGVAGYDTRGNLNALGSGFSANYDAQNEMTSASASSNSMSFAYDALGRCVKRTTNGTASYFYYDGWSLIEEDNSAGTPQLVYVYGPATDELAVMWSVSSNSWSSYHYDARGSVTHLTNSTGQLVEQYTYSAFGTPTMLSATGSQLTTSTVNNRFLFQGRDWIKELGVYEYRNRMYHPGIGRFLQPDPLSLDAGDPNIYRYCSNDPINGRDPLGLEGESDPYNIPTATFFAPANSGASQAFSDWFYNLPPPSTSIFSITSSSSFGSSFANYSLPLLAQLLGGQARGAASNAGPLKTNQGQGTFTVSFYKQLTSGSNVQIIYQGPKEYKDIQLIQYIRGFTKHGYRDWFIPDDPLPQTSDGNGKVVGLDQPGSWVERQIPGSPFKRISARQPEFKPFWQEIETIAIHSTGGRKDVLGACFWGHTFTGRIPDGGGFRYGSGTISAYLSAQCGLE